jgi:hypothetical protein
MDFLRTYFYGVFELPLPRNAQKRTKKKSRKKKSDGGWVGLRFSKCTGGSVDLFLAAPRGHLVRWRASPTGAVGLAPLPSLRTSSWCLGFGTSKARSSRTMASSTNVYAPSSPTMVHGAGRVLIDTGGCGGQWGSTMVVQPEC